MSISQTLPLPFHLARLLQAWLPYVATPAAKIIDPPSPALIVSTCASHIAEANIIRVPSDA